MNKYNTIGFKAYKRTRLQHPVFPNGYTNIYVGNVTANIKMLTHLNE